MCRSCRKATCLSPAVDRRVAAGLERHVARRSRLRVGRVFPNDGHNNLVLPTCRYQLLRAVSAGDDDDGEEAEEPAPNECVRDAARAPGVRRCLSKDRHSCYPYSAGAGSFALCVVRGSRRRPSFLEETDLLHSSLAPGQKTRRFRASPLAGSDASLPAAADSSLVDRRDESPPGTNDMSPRGTTDVSAWGPADARDRPICSRCISA